VARKRHVQGERKLCSDSCSRTCSLTTWALWPMPTPASIPGLPHPAKYDIATAGIVTDKVTGLIWQRAVEATTYALSDAKTYCANLALAGFSDWRLPTRIELVSLVDFTTAGPTIDRVAFPNTPSDSFWTSSHRGSAAWFVGFKQANVDAIGTTEDFYVRCVR
jgi:hypothetical protein